MSKLTETQLIMFNIRIGIRQKYTYTRNQIQHQSHKKLINKFI